LRVTGRQQDKAPVIRSAVSDESEQPEEGIATGAEDERIELPTWNRSRRKRKANVKAERAEDGFQRGIKKAGRSALSRPQQSLLAIVLALGAIAVGTYLLERDDEGSVAGTRALATAAAVESRGTVDAQRFAKIQEDALHRDPASPVYESEAGRKDALEKAILDSKDLPNAQIALLAELLEGTQAMRNGDAEAATTHYNSFLAGAATDHPMRFVAQEGRAFALEAVGDIEGALAVFAEIAPKTGDFYRDMCLWQQGRLLEALDRKDDASAIYQTYMQEYPDAGSLEHGKVRDRLTELDPTAIAGANSGGSASIVGQGA